MPSYPDRRGRGFGQAAIATQSSLMIRAAVALLAASSFLIAHYIPRMLDGSHPGSNLQPLKELPKLAIDAAFAVNNQQAFRLNDVTKTNLDATGSLVPSSSSMDDEKPYSYFYIRFLGGLFQVPNEELLDDEALPTPQGPFDSHLPILQAPPKKPRPKPNVTMPPIFHTHHHPFATPLQIFPNLAANQPATLSFLVSTAVQTSLPVFHSSFEAGSPIIPTKQVTKTQVIIVPTEDPIVLVDRISGKLPQQDMESLDVLRRFMPGS